MPTTEHEPWMTWDSYSEPGWGAMGCGMKQLHRQTRAFWLYTQCIKRGVKASNLKAKARWFKWSKRMERAIITIARENTT